MIRRPIPQAPVSEDIRSPDWQRWFNLVSANSVNIYKVDQTLTFSSVAANSYSVQSVTVNGVGEQDFIISIIGDSGNVAIAGGRVTAKNTVDVQLINPSTSAATPSSGTYTFILIRQKG